MRITLLPAFVLFSFFFASAACTVESSSPPSSSSSSSGGASERPSTTSPTEPPAPTSPTKTDPQPKDEDPKPKTPPKPFFEATIDGEPAVFDETSIELDDGQYELVGVVNATSPYGSDKTLTVRFAKGETGAAACASGKRSADLWYKDDDGTIRGIGTSYIYGGCTMTLDTSIAGYVSGKAQGTLGGQKQKSFSVSFAQKLP